MSLPVSQYEELLAEVRGLRRKAQRVQQLARPLLQSDSYLRSYGLEVAHLQCEHGDASSIESGYSGGKNYTNLSVSSEPVLVINANTTSSSLQNGTWPAERTMWNSEPASLGSVGKHQTKMAENISNNVEINSVMSFASEGDRSNLDSPIQAKWSSQQLEAKMDVVHSLLAMLGGQEHVDMGETLLALSTCPESCLAMRQSGCIPLLVQLVQSDGDPEMKKKASQALHNLVNSQSDEKLRKRESRVLKLLEQCYNYKETLKKNCEYDQPECSSSSEDNDKHPVQTVAHLMKLSFDEGHRQVICQLGGIQTIASLIEAEHVMHGSTVTESHCILMRRYACMALTNLTFGDSGNKALLCSFRDFIRALVIQLQSSSDELRQVTASVLRNLSWRADSTSKDVLREVGSVTGLMKAAMVDNKENTLKTILSALWNLSAHCTENKSEICAVEGSLNFLVDMLNYKTPSKSLAIIENSGGILRNISSQIAVREDYREILRKRNCLQILLDQLKSPSLTIVSNACGTLWNLSAKCALDQEILWQLGAPTMLKSLNHSKHKMIAMGSSAALKNLLSAKSQKTFLQHMDSTALSLDLPTLPMLEARKQKALMQDLDQSLSETYDNIEKDSPIKKVDKSIEDYVNDSRRKFGLLDGNCSGNFTSLNLDEASTTCKSESKSKLKLPQNYVSSSLPYMPTSLRLTNPYCAASTCEEEVDYSHRILDEENLPNNDAVNLSSESERDRYSLGNNDEGESNDDKDHELDLSLDFSLGFHEKEDNVENCQMQDSYKSKTSTFLVSKTSKQNHESSSNILLDTTNIKNLDLEMCDEQESTKNMKSPIENELDKLESRSLLIEEFPLDSTINDSTKSLSNLLDSDLDGIIIDNCLQHSCENSRLVDNRMLDPDAMIESLDRFTAQLVSQASHLTKDEDKYKMSAGTGDNTWNDDCSPNEVTFPSLSGSTPNVITFSNEEDHKVEPEDIIEENQEPSNDFSLINISSATDNTLIAIEASKMVTVFKNEAEMSISITSATSLELDNVQPPSQMNSLTGSIAELDKNVTKSPKLVARKKSLPSGLMVRRALSNSLKSSSLESLSNLDHINPPSDLMLDLEGSITSIASLPHENGTRTDFLINGIIHKESFASNSSYQELENINPPSLFNEITDFCNSLADIPTEDITSEVFASAYSHVSSSIMQDNNATYCDDDITEFSDAHDATPLDSDMSSSNSSPKKQKGLTKSMLTRHRRKSARDRYRTYTVSAMEIMKGLHKNDETLEEILKVEVDTTNGCSSSGFRSKLTPKEKRQINRSRFETQILDKDIENIFQTKHEPVPQVTPQNSNYNSLNGIEENQPKTKLNIRRNFRQKRLENKDRFKTQTLDESSFTTALSSINLNAAMDLQNETDIVLETLNSIKTTHDELLDCETISLVSNEDEHVSRSPINYRTYHRSWSTRKNNIPVISSESDEVNSDIANDKNNTKVIAKPKIVKPTQKQFENEESEEPVKGIRGRRKPLYSRSNTNNVPVKTIKPTKPVTSGISKPTSLIKPISKSAPIKPSKVPQSRQTTAQNSPSGYNSKAASQSNSPKTSPARRTNSKGNVKSTIASTSKGPPPLERQGTFTKEEPPSGLNKTKKIPTRIPTAFTKNVSSQLPPPVSRIPSSSSITSKQRNDIVKSASADRSTTNIRMYNRSISAESARKIPQASNQGVKNSSGQYGATKKSSIPSLTQRSNSNSSINTNGPSVPTKKQVTSKIASLWKKIEESKNQPAKKDTRIWIQAEKNSEPCQSSTFDNEERVILRRNEVAENADPTKRVSRLSSFVIMDENEDGSLRIQEPVTNG